MESFFGLDIGSYELKLVELARKDKGFEMVAFGSRPTPPGSIYSESEADRKKLAEAIEKLVSETKPRARQVVSAFPEAQVFTRVIEIPELSNDELETALKYEAENYLPVPVSEVKFDYTILERGIEQSGTISAQSSTGARKMRVLLVAAPYSLIERYYNTLRWTGLEPVAFETELLSIQRSLVTEEEKAPTALILSMGASGADLAIVHEGKIRLTRSIGTGGEALTKAISQQLGFEASQAEEYMKSYGLREDQLEGKIMQIIKPVLDVVVNEVERVIVNYQSRNASRPVRRVTLTGAVAQLPGLVVYLAESLDLEVQIGDPWQSVVVPSKFAGAVKEVGNQVRFAVAVGLAKKNIQ